MQLHEALGVAGHIGVHSVENAEVVGVTGHVREQFGNPVATLAVLLEGPGRLHQLAALLLGRHLAGVGGQLWLVVKGVDVRGAAPHAQENDPLGPWREVRFDRCQGVLSATVGRGGLAGQSGQGGIAKPAREFSEQIASGWG